MYFVRDGDSKVEGIVFTCDAFWFVVRIKNVFWHSIVFGKKTRIVKKQEVRSVWKSKEGVNIRIVTV
jgi:hypothetical protein